MYIFIRMYIEIFIMTYINIIYIYIYIYIYINASIIFLSVHLCLHYLVMNALGNYFRNNI